MVVGNGLGFSVDFGNGLGFAGWKRAWVCRSQPALADLGLGLPISAWACLSQRGDLPISAWVCCLQLSGVVVVAGFWWL